MCMCWLYGVCPLQIYGIFFNFHHFFSDISEKTIKIDNIVDK